MSDNTVMTILVVSSIVILCSFILLMGIEFTINREKYRVEDGDFSYDYNESVSSFLKRIQPETVDEIDMRRL